MRLLIVLISLFFTVQCFAQKSLPLRFETINQNNGLSNNQVTSFYKDVDGFLWVGTEDGLNKYDGTKFKVYRHQINDSNSLVGNQVHHIYPISSSKFLVSSHCNGLSEFNKFSGLSHQFTENKKDEKALLSNCDIKTLLDDEANFWVKGQTALLLHNTKTKTFERKFRVYNDSSIIYNFFYRKGIIWMGVGWQTLGYNIRSKQAITSPLGFDEFAKNTHIVKFINDDIVLSIGWEKGFNVSDIKKKKTLHLLGNNIIGDVKIVTVNNRKQIWLAADNGLFVANYVDDLFQLTNESFIHYLPDANDVHSIASRYVVEILQDDNGIIWLATANGISKFNPAHQAFQEQFLSSKIVDSKFFNYYPHDFFVHKNSKGQTYYWLSNWHGTGFLKLDTNFNVLKRIVFKHYDVKYSSQNMSLHVSNVFEFNKDTLCIAGWDGLWLYDALNDKLIKNFKFNDKDTSQPKKSRIDWGLKDKEGNIWVGTYHQKLRKLNPKTGNWQVFGVGNEKNQTKRDRNDFLLLDSKNRLWLNEVSYYNFTTKEFVKLKNIKEANAIVEDKKGNIWMATQDGLAKYIEAKNDFVFYNTTSGLLANDIGSLLVDANNNLWATTSFGLVCINEEKNLLRNFTVADGLPSNNLSSVLCQLQNGNILFAPSNNAKNLFITFNPVILLQQEFQLPLHFTSVQIFNKEKEFETSLDSINELHFNYKENLFSIHFKALDFTNAANVRYRYKLINVSNEWIDIGNQDNITFTNLGYGKYNLLVQATNTSGIWMNKTLKMDLIIEPPFWRTTWFYILVGFVIVIALFILIKRRIKTIQAKAALKQQLTDLEMKALRSQMNPHFIFNCLSSIQATIMQGEIERATEYVDKFSLLLRTVLNQSERISITLQEEIDYLTTYLELECFRYEDLNFNINSESIDDAAFIHIPGMLLQPFIENAIQHGLSHKIGEKKIDLLFADDENSIKVTIKDNGIGRAASKEINKNRSLAHQSLGIKNIEDRLRILFKDDKERVEFIDELEGTTVIIEIPIV